MDSQRLESLVLEESPYSYKNHSPPPNFSPKKPATPRGAALSLTKSLSKSLGSAVSSISLTNNRRKDDSFDEPEIEIEPAISDNPMFRNRKVSQRVNFKEPKTDQAVQFTDFEGVTTPKPPKEPKNAPKNQTTGQVHTPKPPSAPKTSSNPLLSDDELGDIGDLDVDEEILFENEMERLDRLPFRERIWQKKIVQRIIVAFLAVALLWSTSLALIKAVVEVGFFPKPSIGEVGDSFLLLFNVTDTERSRYAACTAEELDRCNKGYEAANSAQILEVAEATQTNANNLIEYEEIRFISKVRVNETMNRLIELVANQVLLATYFNENASCPRVEQWVNGQISSANAIGTYDEFTANATEHITSLYDQLKARNAYDKEYLANKTKAAQEFALFLAELQKNETLRIYGDVNQSYADYEGCMTTINGNCGNDPSLLAGIGADMDTVHQRAQELADQYGATSQEVQEFMDRYNQLYNLADDINAQLPSSVSPFDLGSPGVEPSFKDPAELFEDAARLDEIKETGEAFFEEGQKAVDSTGQIASDATDDFTENAANIFVNKSFADEPYEPPPIDESPLDAWNEAKESGRSDLNGTLQDFNPGDVADTADDFELPTQRETNFPDSPKEIVALLPNRSFDFYAYEDDVFGPFEENLNLFSNFIVYADVLYRVLHSLYLINKYWNLSNIGKPPADARVDAINGRMWGLKASPQQRMANMLTHPAVILIVIAVFAGLLSFAFWIMYSPFYEAYKEGCVQHQYYEIDGKEVNGTMIYRNVLALATNFAEQDGDRLQTSQVDKLNVRRQADCNTNFDSSSEKYSNQVNQYFAILDDFTDSLNFRNEIIECLDLERIDAENLGDGGVSVVEKMNDPVFFSNLTEMIPAVYNCSEIPFCSFLCSDPKIAVLQEQSFETSCTAEWWLHASLLASLLVIVTFILANMFRIEFVRAVVRIWWRHLNPFEFSFLGSCTRKGEHIDPEQVTKEHDSFRKTIRDALKKVLRKWERMGYIHAAYAIGLNAPWIAACIFFSQGINFQK